MGEINLAEATSANNSQPAASQGANAGSEAKFSLAEVKNMIDEATRPLFAEVRRIREGNPGRQNKQSDADRTLTQRIQDLEAREARMAEKSRNDALRDAAREAGVPAERLRVFSDHVLASWGQKLVNRDDGTVGYVDLDPDNPKPLKELVTNVLRSAEGDMFRPAVAVATGRGLRPNRVQVATSGRRYEEIPQEERLKMPLQERLRVAQETIASQ